MVWSDRGLVDRIERERIEVWGAEKIGWHAHREKMKIAGSTTERLVG